MSKFTVNVSGLTCHNCAHHVSEELGELAGVSNINVDVVPGGTSTVTFVAADVLSNDDVAAAIAEAGDYRVESIDAE